jgi:hypothetical protein
VVWVINGFASFLPLSDPHFQTAHESPGWTAFLGATIFELGSILGMWEAWNRDDVANFGWNVEQVIVNTYVGARDVEKAAPGKEEMVRVEPSVSKEEGSAVLKPHKKWIWWSTDPKFWHELGFLASFTQLIAASVFWISGSVHSLPFFFIFD